MPDVPRRLALALTLAACLVPAGVAAAREAQASPERCRPPGAPPDGGRPPISIVEQLETSYRLRVDLTFQPARLVVRERIDLCNGSDGALEAVHLSVLARGHGEFRLRGVRVGRRPVEPAFPEEASMLVPIPGGLAPGQRVTIHVRFALRPTADLSTSLEANLSKAKGILRVGDWFPLVSDGHGLRLPGDSQFAASARRIRVDVRYDRPLVVVAPGRLVLRQDRRRVFEMRNARDFAFLAARRLRRAVVRSEEGVRVVGWAQDPADARRMAAFAARAADAFSKAYGPYPWRRLVLAPTPRRISGKEYPGIVFIGQAFVEGPEYWARPSDRRDRPAGWFGAEYVIGHEVAHQWFYALLGNDQMREPWIDEALAEFSVHHFFLPSALGTCSSLPVGLSIYHFPPEPPSFDCEGYAETVYRRGAIMVDGVRRLMGDRAFFRSMRRLTRERRFGILTAEDLIEAWRRGAHAPEVVEAYVRSMLGEEGPPPMGPRTLPPDSPMGGSYR